MAKEKRAGDMITWNAKLEKTFDKLKPQKSGGKPLHISDFIGSGSPIRLTYQTQEAKPNRNRS